MFKILKILQTQNSPNLQYNLDHNSEMIVNKSMGLVLLKRDRAEPKDYSFNSAISVEQTLTGGLKYSQNFQFYAPHISHLGPISFS